MIKTANILFIGASMLFLSIGSYAYSDATCIENGTSWGNGNRYCGKCVPSHTENSYSGEELFWFDKYGINYGETCTVTESSSQTYHNTALIGIKGVMTYSNECDMNTGVYESEYFQTMGQYEGMGDCHWEYSNKYHKP